MAYGVENTYKLDIKIDGVTYPVGESRVKKVVINESVTGFCPVADVLIEDHGNAIIEMTREGLSGRQAVQLTIADPQGEEITHDFQVFKIQLSRSGAASHVVRLLLLSSKSLQLFTPARYRSYASQKISAMVTSIATELGMEYEVEETTENYSLFSPGWTFAQFLTYTANRARSLAHGTAGYLCWVDLDDKLWFVSPDWLKHRSAAVNVLRKSLRDDDYAENDVDLGPYRVYYDPMMFGTRGAWGVTNMYFDFMNSEFVSDPVTLNGNSNAESPYTSSGFTHYSSGAVRSTSMPSLSEKVAMKIGDMDPANRYLHTGVVTSDACVAWGQAAADSQLLKLAGSFVRKDLLLPGDLRVRAGSLVTTQIGSPIPENIINQVFSGKWVVERVTHKLIPRFATRVVVFRSGVNGSNDEELVEAPGKRVT